MKFLIIGDLHGNKPIIHYKDFNAIIAPGDFCSDKIRKYLKGWMSAKDKKGNPYMNSSSYLEDKYGKKFVAKFDKKSLLIGRKILEYLNSFGKPVFIIPGNWDQSSDIPEASKSSNIVQEWIRRPRFFYSKQTNPYLTSGLKNIIDCQFKLVKYDSYYFIGYGLNMVPEIFDSQQIKKRYGRKISGKNYNKLKSSYKKLFKKLENLIIKRDKKLPLIFLSHNMPYNTKFDKIITPGTLVNGMHYGSVIARDFIVKYKPLVCIGGHIHEHFGKIKLGKTLVINSGFGPKVNTLLEIKDSKIKKLKFYK